MADNEIRPDVLNVDDVVELVPKLSAHRRLVAWLLKAFNVDLINQLHRNNCKTPGVSFTDGVLRDLDIKLRVDGEEVLDNLPEGAFVTISNHPYGALDGIILINIIGKRRPTFKVMVNMILNRITAMRSTFIAVDAMHSDDPAKMAVSKRGIMEAIKQVRSGQPIGFFPAGAMSKILPNLTFGDREWQPNIIRLIAKMKVPVVPVYFHGSNSWVTHLLGFIDWRLRTVRLPSEVKNKKGKTFHVSVGPVIGVDELEAHCPDMEDATLEQFGLFLRRKTYELKTRK